MSSPVPNNPNDFLNIFSGLSALYTGCVTGWKDFIERQIKSGLTFKNLSRKTATNFTIAFIPLILLILIAIICFYSANAEKIEASTPVTEESYCEIDPAPITSWPIKRSAMDSWLDEMDGYVSHAGSFYMRNWNDFSPVRIKDQLYPHCIGVCIPFDKLEDYYSKANPDQQVHVEYIEYSLGYAYQTLQFDFGIDDRSYPDYLLNHLRCEFRIVVDSCDSNGFLLSSQTHLFDTDWLNYRCCARRTTEMDVSQCETVRITVMWRFYVQQNGPIAFNMVIANPLLRAAKYKK